MKKNNQELIFGIHACKAALSNSKRKVHKILCTKQIFEKNLTLIENKRIAKIEIMKRSQIDNILGVNMHQGIAVYCDKLSKKCFKNIANDKTILILDSLKDPQNVGSIIRTAHLFGIETILYTKYNSFEINPYLIKTASGAFESINLIEIVNLNQTIDILKKKGFWVVGLDVKSTQDVSSIPKNIDLAAILGSEKDGMKKLSLEKCDFRVNIKTLKSDFVDSLNVSSVSAILLYILNNERIT